MKQIGTAQQVAETLVTPFVADFPDLSDHGPDWLIAAKLHHRGYELQAAQRMRGAA